MLQIRPNPLHYRNIYARIILLTLESRLGRDVLNAALYSAELHHFMARYPAPDYQQGVPATEIHRLFGTLESIHSPDQTAALGYACGEAIARYLLAEHQGQQLPGSLPISAMPLSRRQTAGLQILDDLLSEFSTHHRLHTTPENNGYLFVLETTEEHNCPAIPHLMLGFVAEGMRLFTLGERDYRADLVRLSDCKTGLYLHSPAV